ncbi:MAG: Crp/Fnr family transcriptional regulator [Dehalococcoidia bacterium]|nr:MAG: Crp/Fnr family transcriptional regulator [Dehalococcoidia bacterium]
MKCSSYFSGLGSDELEAISGLVFEKSYKNGAIIILEGEAAEALYFVASGVVKVFKTSSDGKEQTLAIIRPRETFNEVPIFDGDVNPASVQAMTEVMLYGIRVRDIGNILHTYPLVSTNVIRIMAGRLRHLIALVEDLSFRHVIGRVAKILLEYATDGTSPGPRLTQREMASMAGTAREVVSRSLKNLEKDGFIKIDRQRIIIKDREALNNIVSPLFETNVTDG